MNTPSQPIQLLTFCVFCMLCFDVVRAENPSASEITVATFNVSLNRSSHGQLLGDLKDGSKQAKQVARIIRTVQPDILFLNEFDFDASGESLNVFQQDYLEAALPSGLAPAAYAHSFTAEVNTGVPSGLDIDKDGKTTGPADGFGFGFFPGQYGMVVLSKFPIARDKVRTFQKQLWSKMPQAAVPQIPGKDEAWYSSETWKKLRLSSKSHWDVPVQINDRVLHVLASHPTPPAFDGPEDRNGKRNHDEIRLWSEYLTNEDCDWLTDDSGICGGLSSDAAFVIVGDLNADPMDGDSHNNAINQLLEHSRVNSANPPDSDGAVDATRIQGKANLRQRGDSRFDTADFSDRSVGNLRVDYVLPSSNFEVLEGRVVWPKMGEPLFEQIGCSDHRMVWLKLAWRQ